MSRRAQEDSEKTTAGQGMDTMAHRQVYWSGIVPIPLRSEAQPYESEKGGNIDSTLRDRACALARRIECVVGEVAVVGAFQLGIGSSPVLLRGQFGVVGCHLLTLVLL